MPYSKTENRSVTRYAFASTIDYVLEPPTTSEVYKGVIVNISNTGMGVYVFDPLPEGQKINLMCALPVDRRTAAIRWIKKEDAGFYLTGFQFL